MSHWRRRLSYWRHEKAPDWTPTWILVALDKLGCLLAGHEPERDQCGRPEHDFCLWCMKSMPNAAAPLLPARRLVDLQREVDEASQAGQETRT